MLKSNEMLKKVLSCSLCTALLFVSVIIPSLQVKAQSVSLPVTAPSVPAENQTYPTIYTYTLKINDETTHLSTDKAYWYDEQLFVSSIQGIVNQSGPRLYINVAYNYIIGKEPNSDAAASTEFWWDKFRQRGQWLSEYNVVNLETLDDLVDVFKDDLNGLTAWDPKVDSTVNVATTIAGVDKLAVVMHGGYLFNRYTASPYNLSVITNLNDQFTGPNQKTDAYEWAKANYLDVAGKANRGVLGFLEDGFARQMNTAGADAGIFGRDLLILRKGFVFDLQSQGDEVPIDAPNQTMGKDRAVLESIFATTYGNYGVKWPVELIGFTPWWDKYSSYIAPSKYGAAESEWQMAALLSSYNTTITNTDLQQANGSFHYWAPVGSEVEPQQTAPPRQELGTNKTYISIYHGDNDGSTFRSLYPLWETPYRGQIPLGQSITPNNFFSDYKDVGKYYYETATANDYFWTQASGAGYSNPEYWPDLDLWETFNDYYYDKTGLTMSGFLLNGLANQITPEIEEAYGAFSKDGVVTYTDQLNAPDPDVRANNTVFVSQLTSISGTAVEDACAQVEIMLSDKNPGQTNNFVVLRSAFVYPHHFELVYEALQERHPEYNYEIVDPYTLFSLVRQQENNRVNDSIILDVELPKETLVEGNTYDAEVTVRNVGSGTWSFSNQYNLRSTTENQFVWSDWQDGGFSSDATNQRAYLSTTESVEPQAVKVFKFKFTAPANPGTYNFACEMVQDGVEGFGSTFANGIEVVAVPANAMQIVSVDAPEYIDEDTDATISLEVKNIGTATWTKADNYKLGALGFNLEFPMVTDNQFIWNHSSDSPLYQRVELDENDAIEPGQTKTFTFTIRAPRTRGTYTLSARMVQEAVEWFGQPYEKDIRVVPPGRLANDMSYVGGTIPEYMKAGTTQKISVTVKNLGTAAWKNSEDFALQAASNNEFIFSDFKNGGNSNSLTAQQVYLADADIVKGEDTKTFNFSITAPTAEGNYTLAVDMSAGEASFGNVLTFPIQVVGDYGAEFTDTDTIPLTMTANSVKSIGLEVTNTGGNNWTKSENYNLACTANNQFLFPYLGAGGFSSSVTNQRVYPDASDVVLTGQKKMFIFNIQAPSTPGTYTFELTMIRDGVSIFGDTFTMNIQVVDPYSINVNCGGDGYIDSNGVSWSADQEYANNLWGYDGTTYTASTDDAISLRVNNVDQTTYQTVRFGSSFGYKFDVPNGLYRITLSEAEIYYEADRARVFNLAIEDKDIWTALDPWKQMFGHDKGASVEYQVVVTDGQLNLDFTSLTDYAQISGIKIERLSD